MLHWWKGEEDASWGQKAGDEKVTLPDPKDSRRFHAGFPLFEGSNSQHSTEVCCSAGSPGPAATHLTGGNRGVLLPSKPKYIARVIPAEGKSNS